MSRRTLSVVLLACWLGACALIGHGDEPMAPQRASEPARGEQRLAQLDFGPHAHFGNCIELGCPARTAKTIANAQSTTSSAGVSFTASSSIDVAALRTNNAAVLHLMARFSSLTLPAQAQVQATVKTAAGNTLWQSTWKTLGSNTSGQLIDMGETPLSMLRLPVPSSAAANITVTIAIRSTSGATVGATLDYIEALLALDFCRVEASGGLASGQRYDLFGAQNLSGGGWLPMAEDDGAAFDGSDVPTNTLRIKGQLPRAFENCSLYVAWVDSGNAHTTSDTAAITASMAPLWRSLRGVT